MNHICLVRLQITCFGLIAFSNLGFSSDIEGLKQSNEDARTRVADAIVKDQAALVTKLIALAAQKVDPLPSTSPVHREYPWRDSKHLSIMLLGDLRAPESVSALTDNLEYRNPKSFRIDHLPSVEDMFPAVEALIKVGMPAVDPVIRRLSTYGDNGVGRRNCIWILKRILGEKLARVKLEMAIKESEDRKARRNLKAALADFKP